MERFGLTSLDDLPALDTDTAGGLQAAADSEMPVTDSDRPGPSRTSSRKPTTGNRAAVSEAVRIQKALADAGIASRRAAETLVEAGRVSVNGAPASIGQRVDPGADRILVDGRLVGARPERSYLLLNKPAGVTSTVSDRHARHTVLDLVPADVQARAGRLYPVGRLDRDSEGLLRAHQRRRLGPATAASVARRRARVRRRVCGIRSIERAAARRSATASPSRRASPDAIAIRRSTTRGGRLGCRARLTRATGPLPLVSGHARRRAGSGRCAACSPRSAPRSTAWSGFAWDRCGSATYAVGADPAADRRRAARARAVVGAGGGVPS